MTQTLRDKIQRMKATLQYLCEMCRDAGHFDTIEIIWHLNHKVAKLEHSAQAGPESGKLQEIERLLEAVNKILENLACADQEFLHNFDAICHEMSFHSRAVH